MATKEPRKTRKRPVRTPKQSTRLGRPTADELKRRKAKVMDVATRLFMRRGYAATSLVDIAKGAGVATRTLYHHFGDKAAIFRDVLYAQDASVALMLPPSSFSSTRLADDLLRLARSVSNVALRRQSADAVRLMVAESRRFPEMIRQVAGVALKRFRSQVAGVFRALAEQGATPPLDEAESAALFIDLILGTRLLLVYSDWVTAMPSDDQLRAKVALFIQGRFVTAPRKRRA